ncbi:ATP-grasp fold amidoligase family protein [Arthrobacter agilis]|uniref:ATP-grasp fold amidoligase family protein n=1 Tax=Arthrobacter agilis TaxID=37921 RepID=UPI0023660953|nr:ATP-grasp fold amidoligase family protein [Arthrobacter agilis]WDF32126.1 ATP-grasp fold amidoligase family protein [Arthrobacter agilis]
MQAGEFNRSRSNSVFLSFVAEEFRERGTARRAALAQKIVSHPFVASLGMKVPQRLGVLDDLSGLADMDLPDLFVLKLAKSWSSRGVMILERTGYNKYFDHMALENLSSEAIKHLQEDKAASFASASPSWIIEELVHHTLGLGAIPFDYKFYCFRGRVGLVVQIDRNTGPVKIALFDGDFKPLKLGRDYVLAETARPGQPVIPLHAPEMLWWAQRLSLEADSPFVSVDLLDSPQGPIFGEFTYSPGGTHRRIFTFSHAMLDRFDSLMSGGGNMPDQLSGTLLEVRRALVHPDGLSYRAWAGFAYAGGARGAERLHSFYKDLATAEDEAGDRHLWYRHLGARWAGIRDRLRQAK